MAQQVETAQFLPAADVGQLSGELVCYGRSVVDGEWQRMEAGSQSDAINPWAVALFQTVKGVEPTSASEQSAYDKWLDQTSTARRPGATASTAPRASSRRPLDVLFFIAAVIFVYMLFFADRGERAVTQGLLMGAVTSLSSRCCSCSAPRQPVPARRRWSAPRRHGANVADHRRALR